MVWDTRGKQYIDFVTWMYYSAQVVLLGAELTRVYAEHREGAPPPPNSVARRDPEAHPSAAKKPV